MSLDKKEVKPKVNNVNFLLIQGLDYPILLPSNSKALLTTQMVRSPVDRKVPSYKSKITFKARNASQALKVGDLNIKRFVLSQGTIQLASRPVKVENGIAILEESNESIQVEGSVFELMYLIEL